MVINLLSLFLANVLGVQTAIIGLIDGVAEATASILKLISGWLSDRLVPRKNGSRFWARAFGEFFKNHSFYFA
jgi:Na+/melibiose symporter-like transporter